MVWIVVAMVIGLSLVALAVALLKAYQAGKALAGEVGRASAGLEPLAELQVGPPAAPAAPTEAELQAREAALAAREAELSRREEQLAAAGDRAPATGPVPGVTSWSPRHRA